MRSLGLAALVLALGAVPAGLASPATQSPQLTCKYGFKWVTKVVHGHKKRVKVCKKKPAPKPPPPKANLVLTMRSTIDQVTAGNHVVYTLLVENEGPNPADGVTAAVDLPPGDIQAYGYGGSEESSGDCEDQVTATANQLECHLGSLAVETEETGLNAYAFVRIELEPSQAGDYTVTAGTTASSSTVDPSPENASATRSLRVLAGPPAADLSVAVESPAQPASIPDGYEQEVSVTNAGPTEATDVLVTVLLPQGATAIAPAQVNFDILTLLTGSCQPFFYGYQSTAYACFESVAVGETRTATLNVGPSIHSPGTLRTDAVVSSYTRDSSLANNRASAEATVAPFVPSAGIDLRLAFDGAPKLEGGKQLLLPFHLSNLGLGDADQVSVEASISPSISQLGLGLQTANTGVGCVGTTDGPIECRLPEIGSDARVSGSVYSPSIPAGTYTATVTVNSPDLSAPITASKTFQVPSRARR
jgi:uncharacterized repeat protein (TIGR01451 family)